jgi:type IV secretion system protein VirB9
MKPALALLALGLAFAAPALSLAAEAPRPGALDPRIRTIAYDPEQVVLLTGYLDYQMMVEFAPDEHIENVSIGDALSWQVTPNHKANLLFLKPMKVSTPTNMTVVTNRRRYAFELRSHRVSSDPGVAIAYVVRFLYPPDDTPIHVVVTPAPPAPPQRLNTAYTYTGSRASLPSEVFDDGQFTYFQWPQNTSVPALFLVEPDGSESIANYTMRDGYQVIEQLSPRFVLRNGKEVTVVVNEGWRPPAPGDLAPRPRDAATAKAALRAEGSP